MVVSPDPALFHATDTGLLLFKNRLVPATETLIMWAMSKWPDPSSNLRLHETLEHTISDLSLRTLINRSIDRGLVVKSKASAYVGGVTVNRVLWYPIPIVCELLTRPVVQPFFEAEVARRKKEKAGA